MTAYVVEDSNGATVSIGTVLADPLPAGLTAIPITDAEFDGIRAGLKRWNGNAVVDTDLLTRQANSADLLTKLALLRADASTAQTSLQAIRDTPDATFGNVANAQVAVRALQAQVRTEANIQQQVIRRLLAAVLYLTGDLTDTTGT